MQNLKFRLQTCDRFLKRIKNQSEYKQTYRMFRAIRIDLAKQIKNDKLGENK